MPAVYEVAPADWALARQLVPVMREADVQEAWAAAHVSPEEALRMSLESSRDAQVITADGRVIAVRGVGEWSVIGLLGVPWLLTAEEMPRHARQLLRSSREWMAEVKQRYRVLRNHVDARNTEAVRWLEWLEFAVDPALPFGPDRLPFHCFHWESD